MYIEYLKQQKGKKMEKALSYPGKNPVEALKANEDLAKQGIIFVLEPQPGQYKEAIGNVLFYNNGISEVSIMEEKYGGHITIWAPGNQIIFAIQDLENPDSAREPYNRASGYIPVSFKNLDVVTLKNNKRALIEKKPSYPPRNYSLSNWGNSFSRIFERNDVEALRLTIVNALNEKLGIAQDDASVVAEKIINKL